MKTFKMKKGFTLAETLITLGVIGIVAAMTIPNLVQNYQKQQTVVQLKKVYSVLSQALKLSEVDNGPYDTWEVPEYGTDLTDYYEKYLYPYFKVLKVCKQPSDCGYDSNTPFTFSNGTKSGGDLVHPTSRIPFITSDGILYDFSLYSGSPMHKDNAIIIDLNGSKAPNRLGRDVFYFSRGTGKVLVQGHDLSEDEIDENCKSEGYYCGAKIVKDGWKIEDDYPW